MKSFANVNPKDVREAVSSLHKARQSGQSAAPVGGGSDLLQLMKEDLLSPDLLVNLKSLPGLEEIESESEGLRIGGLATLDSISAHPLIGRDHAALAQAAGAVGTPQLRNVGTLAGNVCQRPWCWYFRQGFPCLKNGGGMCYSVVGENQFNAIFGGGPSFIVHPSDAAPALLALEARFRIVGPGGEKTVAASDFFILPQDDVRRENILEPDELLVEILLPPAPANRSSTYVKIMDREAWTHAVVSAAVALEISGGVCRKARIVLGGVAPIPWQVPRAERVLEGKRITQELAAEAGKAALSGAHPLSRNRYKIPMTEALVRRTILSLARQAA